MNATLSLEKPAGAAPNARPGRPRQTRPVGGSGLGQDASREAKRLAAAILEVLAGARTPTETATALGLSVPRYYQLESRALRGLLSACEAKPKGRVRRPEQEVTALRQDNQRLQREITRQQSLLRAAQRSVGWAPPQPSAPAKTASPKTSGKKTRTRRTARALSVAARWQPPTPDAAPPTDVPLSAEVTQRNV